MMFRRVTQLYAGLVLYGFSLALMVRAELGLDPWDVFHQGVNVTGALVLLLWIPIRQRPGLGTVSNVFVVGSSADLSLALIPRAEDLGVRAALLACAVVLNAVATAAYIGARFGPGPRDGLMTGLVAWTGRSVRAVRTAIEVTVLAAGWALGGSVGVGTVAYALLIGPLVQRLLRALTVPVAVEAPAGE